MSTPLMDEIILTTKYVPNHSLSRVLKSRENNNKLKCNKSLKKKLKKYKLRKDGQEDPDIIDVSQSLINSLRIKSPNNQRTYSQKSNEENRPHNYLTKMVRLKKNVTIKESMPANVRECNIVKDEYISLTPKGDQDKKHTDAFKLLMDSRNKSIGSNSPGKEKCEDVIEEQGRTENKELRAKRLLSLNRMAQAKGSLKKLEIEEYRAENINKKMEVRAKRIKHMIVDMGAKNRKKEKIKPSIDKLVEKSGSSNDFDKRNVLNSKTPLLKTIDLFEDTTANLNSNVKNISKEDSDFLKKLSPSIRKKENMLCYFQKVIKESDILQDDGGTEFVNGDQLIVKVKLKARNKLTKKKSKQTNLTENQEYAPGMSNEELKSNISDSRDDSNKRKRNEDNQQGKKIVTNNSINNTKQCHNDCRPKRNTKKPVKYVDDFQLTSSDEELHIFTPKKKRKDKDECESSLKSLINTVTEDTNMENCKVNEKNRKNQGRNMQKQLGKNERHIPKKATRLAPIFVSKPLLDSVAIEAKQKFLQSGVPSQLKKTSAYQINMLATDEFPIVFHIQCLTSINRPMVSDIFLASERNYAEDIDLKEEKDVFKNLLQIPILVNYNMPKFQKNVDEILQDIKKSYPKFPVYRTYHLLRGKTKGEFKDCIYPDLDDSVEIFENMVEMNNVHPDKLSWVDKYKPTTQKQMIGNFESIRELRRWLVTWTENDAISKKNKCESDTSDFYQSDTDSKETMKNENNLLIITGKVGTGKTLSVYAVAAELAIQVIEVNASTKRTGKIMLQHLQEATQSHKVDRGKNSADCAQKLEDINVNNNSLNNKKKRGRKKKATVNVKQSTEVTASQDNVRTGMSLILIDDADIVFDQDDGFCYAISQLIHSSKRPVILVTSSLTCPHLQKFLCIAKIIKMQPFLPRMLGTWLDIMCLVDNNMCSPGFGANTLDLFKGDIRKTINYLQFYMTSHKHLSNVDDVGLLQDEGISKAMGDDENSCMSWGDYEGWGDKNIGSSKTNDDWKYFMTKESQLSHSWNLQNNFYVWWNLPNLLNYSWKCCNHSAEKLSSTSSSEEMEKLNKIANVLNNLSLSDYLGNFNEEPNLSSRPWQSFERDSIIDNENFAGYNKNNDYINEISWELMIKSIIQTQRDINTRSKNNIEYPSMSVQRERDKVVSRHETITNCLNPSAALDRRALALDYWSSCRNICRTEKSKTSTNSKRNNRFCHYLKSLNIVSRNEYFDKLGEGLCLKE